MKSSALTVARHLGHQAVRGALAVLPRETRFALFRRMVDCDYAPPADLVLHIAETLQDLEACFSILHDAYVASGFMKPHPSGLRVTVYHALPTTTTVCAKIGGEVVGTLSMVREGVFGVPLQTAFDLAPARARGGRLAEISALAVRKDFRRTGGKVLFLLMKFMYAYCTRFFDTRHLLIAVNPNRVELYESLLFFERLQAQVVDHYDFANGAPAVGAMLDLHAALVRFREVYAGRSPRRDLYRYFVETELPNLRLPPRRWHTTNDPVMTPALLDHFFNHRTDVFNQLSARRRRLLAQVYDMPEYRAVLPPTGSAPVREPLRRHPRHSIKCPGEFVLDDGARWPLYLLEISLGGCSVLVTGAGWAPGARGLLMVELGEGERTERPARVVRRVSGDIWGLAIEAADEPWRRCLAALEGSLTYHGLLETR